MSEKNRKSASPGVAAGKLEELRTALAAQLPADLVVANLKLIGKHQPTLVVDIDLADGPGNVTGAQLDASTRVISAALDELDPFPGAYTLEVGTVGAVRELRTARDYRRAVGRAVQIRTIEGKKLRGTLRAVTAEKLILEPLSAPEAVNPAPGHLEVALESVHKARTIVDFSGLGE